MKRFFKITRWVAVLLWGGLGILCMITGKSALGLFWFIFAAFALVLEIINSKPDAR